jgi:hypothetical protein
MYRHSKHKPTRSPSPYVRYWFTCFAQLQAANAQKMDPNVSSKCFRNEQ